ncbi:MAG: hypothetical protein QF614_02495, partial [SAR324 cluster bacterium]|nr:hypothetical protein [SAR324 cluster bacterium]
RDHRKTGLVDLLRVTKSLICGELHHHSGLQGKRPAVCQVQDWFDCKEGFENNREKLQKAGFLHMQTQGGTCLPSDTSPRACECGIFPGVQDGEEWDS